MTRRCIAFFDQYPRLAGTARSTAGETRPRLGLSPIPQKTSARRTRRGSRLVIISCRSTSSSPSWSTALAWPAVLPTSEYSLVRTLLCLPVGPAGSCATASSAVMARASSLTRAFWSLAGAQNANTSA